jgi:hypothetical protein
VFRVDVAKVDRGVQRCDMREAWKMLQSLRAAFPMLHEAFRDVSSGAI